MVIKEIFYYIARVNNKICSVTLLGFTYDQDLQKKICSIYQDINNYIKVLLWGKSLLHINTLFEQDTSIFQKCHIVLLRIILTRIF